LGFGKSSEFRAFAPASPWISNFQPLATLIYLKFCFTSERTKAAQANFSLRTLYGPLVKFPAFALKLSKNKAAQGPPTGHNTT
jgi:hypothetical protein